MIVCLFAVNMVASAKSVLSSEGVSGSIDESDKYLGICVYNNYYGVDKTAYITENHPSIDNETTHVTYDAKANVLYLNGSFVGSNLLLLGYECDEEVAKALNGLTIVMKDLNMYHSIVSYNVDYTVTGSGSLKISNQSETPIINENCKSKFVDCMVKILVKDAAFEGKGESGVAIENCIFEYVSETGVLSKGMPVSVERCKFQYPDATIKYDAEDNYYLSNAEMQKINSGRFLPEDAVKLTPEIVQKIVGSYAGVYDVYEVITIESDGMAKEAAYQIGDMTHPELESEFSLYEYLDNVIIRGDSLILMSTYVDVDISLIFFLEGDVCVSLGSYEMGMALERTDKKPEEVELHIYDVNLVFNDNALVRVTAENCDDIIGDGTMSFDPENYILHLNGVNQPKCEIIISPLTDRATASSREMVIDVQGENTISFMTFENINAKITGSGVLNLEPMFNMAIFSAENTVTLDNCSINVEAKCFMQGVTNTEKLTIINSDIKFDLANCFASKIDELIIIDCEIANPGQEFRKDGYDIHLYNYKGVVSNKGRIVRTVDSGIETLADSKKAGMLFNLSGQRVNAGYKGVVIKDGKKVMK